MQSHHIWIVFTTVTSKFRYWSLAFMFGSSDTNPSNSAMNRMHPESQLSWVCSVLLLCDSEPPLSVKSSPHQLDFHIEKEKEVAQSKFRWIQWIRNKHNVLCQNCCTVKVVCGLTLSWWRSQSPLWAFPSHILPKLPSFFAFIHNVYLSICADV